MVFVCFPQVQKSLNHDEFLTIFDKSEQNPPFFLEELFGVDWSESGGERGRAPYTFDNSMGKIVSFGLKTSKTGGKLTVLVWCVFRVCVFVSFYVVFWPCLGLGPEFS